MQNYLVKPIPDGGNGHGQLDPWRTRTGSLANRVYLSLKNDILSLAYRPGEILRKGDICAKLGVSRSPVAEAMVRLAADGLVDVIPQSGTYVSRFSMSEIREGAFLREALELAAVEKVARERTEGQIVLLRRNIRFQEVLLEDGDTDGFYRADEEMHGLIYSFTGYKRLTALAETAWVQVNRARRLILPSPGRVQATLAEHRDIVTQIEHGNVAAAREAARQHLGQLVKSLEPLEQERPVLFRSR